MKKIILSVIIIIIFIGGYFTFEILSFNPDKETNVKYEGLIIEDVYTDKARYNPGDTVNIDIRFNGSNKKYDKGNLYVYFKYLDKVVNIQKLKYTVTDVKSADMHLKWKAPKQDFRGYEVEVCAVSGTALLDDRNTAIDVSSDWSKFPRYGYIADYPDQSREETDSIIESLNKYHIDGLEFYDWQYEHNKPLAGTVDKPLAQWDDIALRDISGKTVKDYIASAHEKNMMAANYNLMYGAYSDYEKYGAKPEWGLYTDPYHEKQDYYCLPEQWATSQLFLFNPANKDWQNYIFAQEKSAMSVYNFDVWHIDTLGQRDQLYDYNGNPVDPSAGYKDFLNNAKKMLGKRILFNPVNGYGEAETAYSAGLDFLYKEVWPDQYSSYSDLQEAMDTSRTFSKDTKNVVLAAYMNYGLAKSGDQFNEPGVRLTDASIFASGGAHIELGDTGMLCNEYFPNNSLTMSDSLQKAMRNYYDFSTAYENLLRDNVTYSYNTIEIPGLKSSTTSEADSIWTFSKEKKGYSIIHLINLIGNKSNAWVDNDGDVKAPEIQKNFKIKYYCLKKPEKVWMASPDVNDGRIIKLKYSVKKDSKGQYLLIDVPSLQYWDMICTED